MADANHEGAVKAITRGLSKHSKDSPGYLIHTSGKSPFLTTSPKSIVALQAFERVREEVELDFASSYAAVLNYDMPTSRSSRCRNTMLARHRA